MVISALRQKSKFEFRTFWKKIKFWGSHAVVLVKDLSIDVSIQTDGQTDRQTDTVLESSYGNMSAYKKFQLKAQN